MRRRIGGALALVVLTLGMLLAVDVAMARADDCLNEFQAAWCRNHDPSEIDWWFGACFLPECRVGAMER